jgi:hypothetical protein
MKAPLLLLLLFCFATAALAQNHTMYMVKAGTTIRESIPADVLFHYPDFKQGRIFYKDGRTAGGRLNYHRMLDELQFIDPKGDTLAVDNEPTIQLVVMGTDSFYYHEGYVRLLRQANGVKLASKQWLQMADRQKMGGYGQPSFTSAITNLKSYDDGRRLYDLTVKEDLVFSPEHRYYLGDKYNRFLPATRKNVLDLFNKHQKVLKQYFDEKKVDFQKAEDIEQLYAFLVQL